MKTIDKKKIELHEGIIMHCLPAELVIRPVEASNIPVNYFYILVRGLEWIAAIELDKRYCLEHNIRTHVGEEDTLYCFRYGKVVRACREKKQGGLMSVTRDHPCVRTYEEAIAMARVFGPIYKIIAKKRKKQSKNYQA
jgi:hypothetical protein